MVLNNRQVNHIAALARIGMTPDEAERYASELSTILDLVAQMSRVNTDGVEPLTHPRDPVLGMRGDRVTETDHRDEFQRIAPVVETGLYLVPRVVE